MPTSHKRSGATADSTRNTDLARLADRPQIDFEMDFFESLITRIPDYSEALQAQAGNLTSKGRLTDGLAVDQRIVSLKPSDPTAHYNLACRYALMQQRELALAALRTAIDLGYQDFRFMSRDEDLKSLRKDPRFRQLLKESAARRGR